MALTYTLASRSDEPRADSLEISRFLPSFLGKMAVFDKTESLVMMPLCSAFTAADKTDVLVAFYGGEAASSCPRSGQLRTPDKKELSDEQMTHSEENNFSECLAPN